MRVIGTSESTRHLENGGCYGSNRLEIVDPGASGEAVSQRHPENQPFRSSLASEREGGRENRIRL